MPTISKLAVWRVCKCHAYPASWATSVWMQMAQLNGNSIFCISFLRNVVRKSCTLIPELLPFWCILWLQWQLDGNRPGQSCSSSNTSIEYILHRAAMEKPVEFLGYFWIKDVTTMEIPTLERQNRQQLPVRESSPMVCVITATQSNWNNPRYPTKCKIMGSIHFTPATPKL